MMWEHCTAIGDNKTTLDAYIVEMFQWRIFFKGLSGRSEVSADLFREGLRDFG